MTVNSPRESNHFYKTCLLQRRLELCQVLAKFQSEPELAWPAIKPFLKTARSDYTTALSTPTLRVQLRRSKDHVVYVCKRTYGFYLSCLEENHPAGQVHCILGHISRIREETVSSPLFKRAITHYELAALQGSSEGYLELGLIEQAKPGELCSIAGLSLIAKAAYMGDHEALRGLYDAAQKWASPILCDDFSGLWAVSRALLGLSVPTNVPLYFDERVNFVALVAVCVSGIRPTSTPTLQALTAAHKLLHTALREILELYDNRQDPLLTTGLPRELVARLLEPPSP